jgi:hypothetical protein
VIFKTSIEEVKYHGGEIIKWHLNLHYSNVLGEETHICLAMKDTEEECQTALKTLYFDLEQIIYPSGGKKINIIYMTKFNLDQFEKNRTAIGYESKDNPMIEEEVFPVEVYGYRINSRLNGVVVTCTKRL